MRKKYLAVSLSFCMILTTCMPLISNAESMEESIDSVTVSYEEAVDDDENSLSPESQEEDNIDIIDSEEDFATEAIDEETVIEPEDVENSVQSLDIESLNEEIQVYEDAAETDSEGYTRAYYGKALNYGFKYVENEKTLYIKVWDGTTAAISGGKSTAMTGWVYNQYCPNGLSAEIIQEIQKVVIGKGITSIPNKAFMVTSGVPESYCSLKKVEFTNDLQKIGTSAFQNTPLEEIDCKNVSSIGNLAFQKCEKLENVSFGNKNVTFSNNPFMNATQIKNICYVGTSQEWKNISQNVTIPEQTFVHCKADTEKPKAATCTEPGLKELVCAVCGEAYTDGTEIPALDHDYSEEYTVDRAATCTETGSESKHCTRCDEIEAGSEKEIPALGHDYVAEVTTQPTCTKDGVRTLTCSRCKDVKTETIPATGEHKWSDWKKTADATVFAAEQQERSCATCDKKETRTVGEKLAATATVSVSSVTLKEKQSTGTVKITGLANGDSITSWKSTDTKVFTVTGKADGTCKLTGVKKGDAKLEIMLASGLKKTVSVKIQPKIVTTSKISGLAKKMTVKKGAKTTLKPVITPSNSQQKVTYSSSDKSVATVSSKGVITAKKAGTAKITVKSGSKKVTVTVTVPKTKTTAIKVGEKVSVKKGKTYSLKAKVTPSNSDEKITYSTSNKKIATVSKAGNIKGIKKGKVTITIKSGKIVKKIKVTVK